jgi:hypothetical protein
LLKLELPEAALNVAWIRSPYYIQTMKMVAMKLFLIGLRVAAGFDQQELEGSPIRLEFYEVTKSI